MGIGMANNDNQVQQGIATRPGTSSIKPTQLLHDLGQSLWLDNITRDLLNNGTLERYIDELSVTGLTSNPTIFEHSSQEQRRLRHRDSR